MANLGFIFAVLSLPLLQAGVIFPKSEIVDITVPNTEWDGVKEFQCTAFPVKANRYINMFYPLHQMKTVKHISAILCSDPFSTEKYWECGKPGTGCRSGKIVALWAMGKDAPAWYLPEDYAMPTGSKDTYIIVQVHAPLGMTLPSTPEIFATGLRVNITNHKPKYYSGMAVYSSIGHIPANVNDFTVDASCIWPYDNNPVFALNIHSHNMASAVAGYIYREGKFIELLRADPVYPEPNINMEDRKLVLKKGDNMIMRCTLTNPTDEDVKFGFGHTDQMCALCIFYGIPTEDFDSYGPIDCTGNAQTFHLNNTFMPKDSTLPDKEGYAKMLAPFHLKKTVY